ncbi:MAG: Uma2 family endonuclease [Verrucomicrobia bacterium]|nr:Uma2 family endonuclease [Verrucomicrobiota bacterium]
MLTAAAPPKPSARRLFTSEEFLAWLQPGVFADLIDGEIVMHSPVNLRHADLVNFVERLLAAYIEHEDLGVLHRESVAVRLSTRETFLPDLAFFTKGQVTRLAPSHAPFAPTFVLEALSPGTADRDTGQKFASYELHDVMEYWILDPQKLDHRFYRREGDMLSEFADAADRIDSASIAGFWVKRAWLNPEKFPKVSACLTEILAARKAERRRRRG